MIKKLNNTISTEYNSDVSSLLDPEMILNQFIQENIFHFKKKLLSQINEENIQNQLKVGF
jgi:hypothetical protein